MGEFDAVGTAAALPDVIEGIRAALEPLHVERYADLQEKLGQGSMERAKMDVLLAYTINDLIWGRSSPYQHETCENHVLTRSVHANERSRSGFTRCLYRAGRLSRGEFEGERG